MEAERLSKIIRKEARGRLRSIRNGRWGLRTKRGIDRGRRKE